MKSWMTGMLAMGAALAISWPGARSARAEREVQTIDWVESLPAGATSNADGSVTVVSSDEDGGTWTLAVVDAPPIETTRYVVQGQAHYRDVDGAGYVEMWNVFADGRYFTRTNLEQGPMRSLSGTSEPRPIVLPFDATGSTSRPRQLVINVVLPGTGEVTLTRLTLSELEQGEWPSALSPDSRAGLWGGLAGALFGTLAGVLGWLGGKGKAKGLVLTGFRALMAAGAVALLIGLVSLFSGRPYHVYYPLLLLGGLGLFVPAMMLPRLTQRYEAMELRRMSALDA